MSAPILKFKNYRPAAQTLQVIPAAQIVAPQTAPSLALAESLRSGALPVVGKAETAGSNSALPASAAASATAEVSVVTSDGAPSSASAAAAPSSVGSGGDITIAPRKPNWDLKRDAQKKLDILDRQTDRAIVEIVRATVAARQAAAAAPGGGAAGASAGSVASSASASSSAAPAGHAISAATTDGGASDELVFAVMSRDAGAEEIDLG